MLDVTKELSKNFIEYAVAVNSDRSIPDAKSGLKPVARRIIFGAFDTGRTSAKPYVKNARIVGDVMGALHPHGDSSIYGALVRLSQDWVMRYPLIDFHGNQGSINGDGPAAMRYTEGRLSKLAEEGMLAGLKKRNVDFVPTYDDSSEEPVTLPAIFPNLLCNPNSGIGVAMACNWGCHNLREVETAILDYLAGKEPMLPGPDFPTGGVVINKDDIPNIMRTGHGSVKIRAKYKVTKNQIIFTEIPYGTAIEDLVKEIGEYCDTEDLGVVNVNDQTNNKGIKIVLDLQKNANPESIVQKLFAKTNLQTTFSYNQVALVNKVPTEMNLKDCCRLYVDHNIECIVREANFDIKKALDREHIVKGLLKALEDIDNIIALIRKSASAAEAKDKLITTYNFSDAQAKAILDMKLAKLANLEKIELENEAKELRELIDKLDWLINHEDAQIEELKTRLHNIVKKFGDDRRTELLQIDTPKVDKEIAQVVPEDVVVIMTAEGMIKKVLTKSFKVQRKNGKGTKLTDAILDTISTNTVDTLMLFTSLGRMYRLLVDKIPDGTNSSKGVSINSLISLEPFETVQQITSLYRTTDAKYVIFLTKKGIIKKTELEEYKNMKRSGCSAIKLKDGDAVANITFINEEDMLCISKNGKAIKFDTKSIAATGRVTMGVKAMSIDDSDELLVGLPVHKQTDQVAVFAQSGLAKKTALNEFSLQARGGKGVIIYKEPIAGAAMVSDEDNIFLMGKPNGICISAKEIPSIGRSGLGNQMIKNSEIKRVLKL